MFAEKILAVKYNKVADESRNCPGGASGVTAVFRAVHMPVQVADGSIGVGCNIWLNYGVI